MNIFHFLSLHFPFLDVAFGPSFSMGEIDPATKVIVIGCFSWVYRILNLEFS